MQRTSERNTRSRSTRKFRFFTDTQSVADSSYQQDLSEPREALTISQKQKENKQNGRFRDFFRRNYKFLTETQYSNPLYSALEQDSFNLKRSKSPLQQPSFAPQKKQKVDEGEQVDLNKIVSEGLDFIGKIRQSRQKNKK